MKKFLSILSAVFCVVVSANSFADALSILSKTPATVLDLGVIKLEKRLNEIAEESAYPRSFRTPNVMILTRGSGDRPRGIEIQVSSEYQIFNTEEDAINGCKDWFSYMRLRAGYNTKTQKYILDSDDGTDDRISFFVLEFDSEINTAINGVREAIEDSFSLYCSATFSGTGSGYTTLISKIGEVGHKQL